MKRLQKQQETQMRAREKEDADQVAWERALDEDVLDCRRREKSPGEQRHDKLAWKRPLPNLTPAQEQARIDERVQDLHRLAAECDQERAQKVQVEAVLRRQGGSREADRRFGREADRRGRAAGGSSSSRSSRSSSSRRRSHRPPPCSRGSHRRSDGSRR